jgi:hypothetical protein
MSKKKADKRKGLRFGIQKSKATILHHNTGLFAFLKGEPKALPIINISSKGLKLLSGKQLDKNAKISIGITIPFLGTTPLFADGKVIWTKPFIHFPDYIVGVKFTSMPTSSRKRLKHLVAFLGNRIGKVITSKKVKRTQHLPAPCTICHFAPTGQGNLVTYRLGRIG